MRRQARFSFTFAVLLTAAACSKSSPDSAAPAIDAPGSAAEADACSEGPIATVLEALQARDHDALLGLADDELAADLTVTAFADLSGVVGQLGSLQSCKATGDSSFELEFERGALDARLTLTDGRLHGLYFGGDAFQDAQHSVLGQADVLFKVYDFYMSESDGTPLEAGATFTPGRQHFILVVGGFQAKEGEHHVTLRKRVTDAKGKVVYDSDDEMDVTFSRNLEGVRTAKVLKYVDLDAPGTYNVTLNLQDEVSGVKVEHQSSFEIAAP